MGVRIMTGGVNSMVMVYRYTFIVSICGICSGNSCVYIVYMNM